MVIISLENQFLQFKSLPSFVQKAIKPPRQVPNYGKNVNWMHNKLKLIVNLPGGEAGWDLWIIKKYTFGLS